MVAIPSLTTRCYFILHIAPLILSNQCTKRVFILSQSHWKASLRKPVTSKWQSFASGHRKWIIAGLYFVSYRQFYHLEHSPAGWRERSVFKAPLLQNYFKISTFDLFTNTELVLGHLLPEERYFNTLWIQESSENWPFVCYVSIGNHSNRVLGIVRRSWVNSGRLTWWLNDDSPLFI